MCVCVCFTFKLLLFFLLPLFSALSIVGHASRSHFLCLHCCCCCWCFTFFFSLLDLMKILRHNENRMRQHKLKTIESLQVYVSVYVFVFVPPLCFTKLISHYVTCRYCYCLYLLLLFQLIWSCNGRLYNRLMYTHTHT